MRKVSTPFAILLLCAGVGCGDAPDSVSGDPDAQPQPAAGSATLRLTQNGGPLPNQRVYVSKADGSYRETVETDGDGRATAELDGQSLFTIDDDGLGFVTSVVISPGEELSFELFGIEGPQWVLEPTAVELEGAGYYEYSSCEGQTHPEFSPKLYATAACVDEEGFADAIALAYSAEPGDGGELLGYQLARKALSTETLEDAIAFSSEWLTDFATLSAYVSNLPAGYEMSRVAVELLKDGQVFPGVDFRSYDRAGPAPYVPGFADDLAATVEILKSGSYSRTSITQLASAGTEFEASEFLPLMTGSLDLSAQPWSLSWAGGADGTSVIVVYLNADDDVGFWRVVGPPGPVDVSIPVLPAEVGPTYPGTAQFASAFVNTVDFPDADGFAEVGQLGRINELGRGNYSQVARRLVRDGQRLRQSFVSLSTLDDVPASQMIHDRAVRELDARLRHRR